MKGQEEVHIRAPVVISNAGIFNTYQTLLPRELQALPGQNRAQAPGAGADSDI